MSKISVPKFSVCKIKSFFKFYDFITDYWDTQDSSRFLGNSFWDPQNRLINLSTEGLRLKVIKGKKIPKETDGNKVLLAVKFTKTTW